MSGRIALIPPRMRGSLDGANPVAAPSDQPETTAQRSGFSVGRTI